MRIGYLMQAGVPDVRQDPLSGAANHVKRVIEELIDLGHQVRLLALIEGQIWKTDDLKNYEPVIVRYLDSDPFCLFESAVRRIQHDFQLPYIALFESLRFAKACLQELSDFDVFYERMGWMGFGGALASRWSRIPLILEINGDHLRELELQGISPRGLQRRLSIDLTKIFVRNARYFVATGDGWKQKFIERWEISQDKITVIENGSEMVYLLAREDLRSFQKDENINNRTTIVFVGGFKPWHGVEILVQAFAEAKRENTPARLILIGFGSRQSAIEELINNLNVGEYVTLTGQLNTSEISQYLANADIGVSPYCGRVEYSGLKLLDYKAAGLAIIASGENGQPAVIQHGQTGWIVPPCDEEALCSAIIYLANNSDFRRQMGRRARLEAEQCHSWHRTAEFLVETFNQVLSR